VAVARAHPAPAGRGRRHPPRLTGEASVYSRRLAGRPMADGTPLDLNTNAAASRQLPLGSRARVTNLGNGRSAEVQIKDRGPYVQGRIIDVSPKTASELGLHHQGVTRVEVTPLEGPRS
jgi:rare lipoprotein A